MKRYLNLCSFLQYYLRCNQDHRYTRTLPVCSHIDQTHRDYRTCHIPQYQHSAVHLYWRDACIPYCNHNGTILNIKYNWLMIVFIDWLSFTKSLSWFYDYCHSHVNFKGIVIFMGIAIFIVIVIFIIVIFIVIIVIVTFLFYFYFLFLFSLLLSLLL